MPAVIPPFALSPTRPLSIPTHPPLSPSLSPSCGSLLQGYVAEAPERFFVSEIIRRNVFLQYQQEIPYSVAVEVVQYKERRPPAKDFVEASRGGWGGGWGCGWGLFSGGLGTLL